DSEAGIPSGPIEMPAETAMVVNSSGNPPAARTPSLAALARRASGRLQGVTSFQEEATPTWERPQSSSPIPTARSMARAGARSIPSVTSLLRGLCSSPDIALKGRTHPALPAPRAHTIPPYAVGGEPNANGAQPRDPVRRGAGRGRLQERDAPAEHRRHDRGQGRRSHRAPPVH